MTERVSRGTITILFTDVEGSTSLRTTKGDEVAHEMLAVHERTVRDQIAEHEGREIKSTGDGFMVAFGSVRDAVTCAVGIQKALAESEITVRIGLNSGEAIEQDGDLFGEAVNAAARIMAKAKGGEILASEVVRQLAGTMPGVVFTDRGPVRLKGFADPWRLHEIAWHRDAAAPRSAKAMPPFARARPERALLERERELDELDRFVHTPEESGGLLVIEGAAGIGKTRLLGALCERAGEAGVKVSRARGAELERDFAFGVVRQLFEADIASATEQERDRLLSGAARLVRPLFGDAAENEGFSSSPDASFRTLHGLYWLCANMAEAGPLLLAVDDAHWSDEASLRFLSYLARRLEDMPVLVAVAARPNEPGASAILNELAADQSAHVLRLDALSRIAVTALVRRTLTADAAQEFCDACYSATGGNAFLLSELLRELSAEGVTGSADQTRGISELTPARVGRTVLLRLARLPSEARTLATAVATLGDDVALSHAAAFSGLNEQDVRKAADTLANIEILRPGEPFGFIHPLVRTAVYKEIPNADRAEGHAEAARLLHNAGAEVEHVAAHLLLAPPSGTDWRVASLRSAAQQAVSRGAPDAAITYLRRARAEPPAQEAVPDVLYELGLVEVPVRGFEGLTVFREALALADDPRKRATIALQIGSFLGSVFYSAPAVEICEQGLEALGGEDDELRTELEVALILAGIMEQSTAVLAAEQLFNTRQRLGRAALDDPVLSTVIATLTSLVRPPASVSADHAARAVARWDFSASVRQFVYAALPMLWADRAVEAQAVLAYLMDDARRIGSRIALAWAGTHITRTAFRQGNLAEAEAEARMALDVLESQGWEGAVAYAVAPLVDALIERGAFDETDVVLERAGLAGELDARWPHNELLHTRGRLRIAQGRVREGLDDIRECGRRLESWNGIRNPAYLAWRSTAAIALDTLGEHDEAARLADEEVALAREFDVPIALGRALAARGVIAGGEAGIALLQEAVATLEPTAGHLEHARALVYLGAALRRAGHRTEAREPLREGLDIARRCGASVLAARGNEELLAAGAKPQRRAFSGLDALTSSERRVADMAVQGMTNREIAESLFVSLRTVETHLTHAYSKLHIASRAELAGALR